MQAERERAYSWGGGEMGESRVPPFLGSFYLFHNKYGALGKRNTCHR